MGYPALIPQTAPTVSGEIMFRNVTTWVLIVPVSTLFLSVFAALAQPDWEPGSAQYEVKVKHDARYTSALVLPVIP